MHENESRRQRSRLITFSTTHASVTHLRSKPTLFINTAGAATHEKSTQFPAKSSTFGSRRARWWSTRRVHAIHREQFRERLEIDTPSDVERVHAVIDRTHRAFAVRRCADQLSRHRAVGRFGVLGTGTAHGSARCCSLAARSGALAAAALHATRTGSGLGSPMAHTHGPRLNASSVDYLHRGSRVLAARVSASDWEARGAAAGTRAAPRRPLPPMNDNNGRRSTRPQTE